MSVEELQAANETIQSLRDEITALKSKDQEDLLAGLRADLEARAAEIESLRVQLDAVTLASTEAVTRAETAEAALSEASDKLAVIDAEKVVASRRAYLVERGADLAHADLLVANLAKLDEVAFKSTVDVVAATWAKKTTKVEAEIQAIETARPEPDPALAAEFVETADHDKAAQALSDWFTNISKIAPKAGG
jgi:hypothetical protein